MNLADVIENLVEERGLDKDRVVDIVCDAIKMAYNKKYPSIDFEVTFCKKSGQLEVFVRKTVVSSVEDDSLEISVRKARGIKPKVEAGEEILVLFDGAIGRIEILAARQIIAHHIKELEEGAVYDEYVDKQGKIVTGVVHKKERFGVAVNLGDVTAFLPNSCTVPGEVLRVGYSVKALMKEVLQTSRGGYQLILDRASAGFVQHLLELEIPEIFEGVVEIKQIVRAVGYKTKVALISHNSDIDPVGTCVGVGGVRIKPILKGLGLEKIDLIPWTDDLKELIRVSLKPAVIDDVVFNERDNVATISLAEDQRAFAIGRGGQNIALASELTGVQLSLEKVNETRVIDDPFQNMGNASDDVEGPVANEDFSDDRDSE